MAELSSPPARRRSRTAAARGAVAAIALLVLAVAVAPQDKAAGRRWEPSASTTAVAGHHGAPSLRSGRI